MFGRGKDLSSLVDSPEELEIFKLAAENALDQIVIVDAEGRVVYVNAATQRMTGYSHKEMLGKEVGSLGLWGGHKDRELYAEIWDTIKTQKKVFVGEAENVRKDGTIYDVIMRISPFLDKGGAVKFYIGIESDITAKREMQRSHDEFKLFFDLSVDMFCIVDANGVFSKVNPAFEKALGWSEAEIIGKLLILFVYVDDREVTLAELDKLQTGKITTHFKSRFHLKDGGYLWIGWTATPMPNGSFHATLRDITREERIDKAKTEFVSLASHQLRTPLTAIKWYTALLLKGGDGPLNVMQEKYINKINEGNERMIELVGALLDVSRIDMGTQKLNVVQLDAVSLGQSAVDEQMQEVDAKKIELDLQFESGLPVIVTDKKVLFILFQNLLSNAIKYTPKKGKIKFAIKRGTPGVAFGGDIIGVDSIIVEVSDNGMGIPEDQQGDVFRKLFRARNAMKGGSGTGLGLYIVKSFVELAGGRIWFVSKENKGTTFYAILPLNTLVSGKVE